MSYRVATLFGQALWALRIEAGRARRPMAHREAFAPGDGYSVVSSGRGCAFSLANDPEVIELSERAHRAFPDIPLLGVDVLRDADTGELFVVEVNSLGYTCSDTRGTSARRSV